jgi:hypothetical protein
MQGMTEREMKLVACVLDRENWTKAARSIGVSVWTVAADREKLSLKI